MKKTLWLPLIAVLLVAFIAVAGCGSSGPAKKTAPRKAEPGGTPAKNSASVEISNFAMNPDNVTVPKGGKVTWTNKDSVAHTVTANNGEFDSGQIDPGKIWSHTFDTAGTFGYHCTIHPSMAGTIAVE